MKNFSKSSAVLIMLSIKQSLASHYPAPQTDVTNINDITPRARPRYLKNASSFTLISTDDGSIEAYADDKVISMGGTFSTWIDKETDEYFFYIRPVMLSEDKPDRVTIFA